MAAVLGGCDRRGFWLDTLGTEGSALASSKPAKKAYPTLARRTTLRSLNISFELSSVSSILSHPHIWIATPRSRWVRRAQAAQSDERADRFNKEWQASVLGPSFLSFLGDYLYHGSRGPSRRGGALIEIYLSLSRPYYPF